MLDQFVIFTRRGVILLKVKLREDFEDPVDSLIQEILLNERNFLTSYSHGDSSSKWILSNEHKLIFVASYNKNLQLGYVEELLETVKKDFSSKYAHSLSEIPLPTEDFAKYENKFMETLFKIENKYVARDKTRAPRTWDESEKKGRVVEEDFKPAKGQKKVPKKFVKKEKKDKKPKQALGKLAKKFQRGGKEKKLGDGDLNFSPADDLLKQHLPEEQPISDPIENSSSSSDEEEAQADNSSYSIFNVFKSITGGKVMTDADLDGVMEAFRLHLVSRNVAEEIAQKLCESVKGKLLGAKTESFTTVKTTVKDAMKETLTTILTPKKSIDILSEITRKKEEGSLPYTIVFVGVNGVGKTTSLAKVASWLMRNNIKVLMAACDSFRSGAVEQLSVHSKRLNIPLHQKGYGKDPSDIAKDATKICKRNDIECLLIDTAGRMQDNEPLIRQLANLLSSNNPDLVLFVGEALVGNEAIHQLTTFNDKLYEYSKINKSTHQIDGIFITKFDTIDDKVGAALSMTYSTGHPILFTGVGQNYTDIREFKVNQVVEALIK